MKKKLLLTLMVSIIFIITFSNIYVSAETAESGTYGENITWEFNCSNGTLTISGTGDMSDNYNGYPWYSLKENVKSVIIENGITSIGYRGFYYFDNMTRIEIPDSVTTIGGQAFDCCNRLTSVNIPEGVTTIKNAAFRNCYRMTEIIIADSVTTIEPYAFANCEVLCDIAFPKSISTIDEGVFSNCRGITNIVLPQSVKIIKTSAFENCKSLKTITFPNELDELWPYVFKNCTSLETIYNLPWQIKWMAGYLFENCTSLKDIYFNGTKEWWNIIYGSGDLGMDMSEVTIHCVDGDIGGNEINWTLDENGVLTISGTGKMYNYFDHDAPWEADKLKIKKVVIEKGVTKIGAHSFCGCKNLDSVMIPASVISSGKEAFCCDNYGGHVNKVYIEDIKSWCNIEFQDVRANPLIFDTKLYLNNNLVENLVIPEDMAEIGWAAFYGCSSIKTVSIPSAMTGEYWYIFNSCNNLEEIVVDNDNPTYCSIDGNLFSKDKKMIYQFCNGKKDTKYIVPDSVTQIGDEAFFNCTNLQYVILPDSLTIIGNSCFNGCTSLKEIKIPNSVTEISWWTFSRCKSLTNITIPNTVVEIYDNAFNSCANLSDIYYFGTPSEWNDIVVGTNNNAFSNAKVHFSFTDTTVANGGKSFSITPINIERGKTVILALYNGEQFVEMQSAVYTGEAVPFTITKTYTKAKVMVWDDLTNLKIVCDVEKVQ